MCNSQFYISGKGPMGSDFTMVFYGDNSDLFLSSVYGTRHNITVQYCSDIDVANGFYKNQQFFVTRRDMVHAILPDIIMMPCPKWLLHQFYPASSAISPGGGGGFKNTYDELLNLRVLKYSPVNKINIFQCMGEIFCVEFQRYPLKFHTKHLTHTLKDMIFVQHWNFKSS